MVRVGSIARVCVALTLVTATHCTTAADPTTNDASQWTVDYQRWIEDIKTSVAGNAALEQKAVELQHSLDAAVATGVSETDRMRLLYDFLNVADSDPTFTGFVTKDATAVAPAPAATTTSAAMRFSALASLSTIALAALSYTLL